MKQAPHKRRRNIRNHFTISRDGVITGAADNDPAGIATYLQVGATTGFSLLWLVPVITPLVIAVEEMSARVGVVTKRGLSRVIRERYGPAAAYLATVIVLICNIATIAANLGAMAEILSVFTGVNNLWFVFIITAVLMFLLVTKGYEALSRYLIFTTLVLLLYIAAGFMMRPEWGTVLAHVFAPVFKLDNIFLLAAVGFIGTTISPYLLFWQATAEVEDKKTVADLRNEAGGVITGFLYANIVAFFIILTAALTFAGHELIPTTTQAALALKPLAGHLAFIFFSVGILGSGMLGIPVLAASTAYVGAEALQINVGLSRTFRQARGFYVILISALAAAGLLAFVKLAPMLMLLYSQVLNGMLTPILIIMLLLLTNNSKIMGKHTNGFWSNLLGVASLILMLGFDIALLLTYF